MINNKKGLSAIIVTLIMILLVIVASGIIWVVIQNIVEESTEQIDLSTDCLSVEVNAITVTNTSVQPSDDYSVVLERSAGGKEIDGVKVVLTNATLGVNNVSTYEGNIEPYGQKLVTFTDSGVDNANQVKVVAYFKDSSGNPHDCAIPSTYEFQL